MQVIIYIVPCGTITIVSIERLWSIVLGVDDPAGFPSHVRARARHLEADPVAAGFLVDACRLLGNGRFDPYRSLWITVPGCRCLAAWRWCMDRGRARWQPAAPRRHRPGRRTAGHRGSRGAGAHGGTGRAPRTSAQGDGAARRWARKRFAPRPREPPTTPIQLSRLRRELETASTRLQSAS